MPKDAEEKALTELKRLESMPPMSAEATVSRNYLDWLIAVPWTRKTRERKDLSAAEKMLNEDHYGLEKVKERIVEFLAVRQLVNNPKGPILCFVGPPGVGKTSLARSIAPRMPRPAGVSTVSAPSKTSILRRSIDMLSGMVRISR
jgi:ATP-dependent Lon protease